MFRFFFFLWTIINWKNGKFKPSRINQNEKKRMFYRFCLREKIPMFMVNFIASRGECWKSKQRRNRNSNSNSWGEKKKKKISYMIDINNKWKKSEYEKKNAQGQKKTNVVWSEKEEEDEEEESKNRFNQLMVIGTNTLDHKTIKLVTARTSPFVVFFYLCWS